MEGRILTRYTLSSKYVKILHIWISYTAPQAHDGSVQYCAIMFTKGGDVWGDFHKIDPVAGYISMRLFNH
jgi:hypothetical protein